MGHRIEVSERQVLKRNYVQLITVIASAVTSLLSFQLLLYTEFNKQFSRAIPFYQCKCFPLHAVNFHMFQSKTLRSGKKQQFSGCQNFVDILNAQ